MTLDALGMIETKGLVEQKMSNDKKNNEGFICEDLGNGKFAYYKL